MVDGDALKQQPSAVLAFLGAVVIAIFARVLFPYAEAGPSADFLMPVFPFLTGVPAAGAARYGARAWRAARASPVGGARTFELLLSVAALLVDLLVIGFALLIVFFMTFGSGIR